MYKKITLENGVRLVCEKIPYVRSVSVGIWIGTGSRNEKRLNNGISHFIEHMLFKGTEKRSSKEIAESIDNIGGQLNAFTGKECTCYYTKTLDTHIEIAVDVLSDMLFNSKFDEKDLSIERKVISEEIGMYEDSPEELVHDVLSGTVWKGNSLGYPILGSQRCLDKIDRGIILEFVSRNYVPENCVISVAGNYDDDKLVEMISKYFSGWSSKKNESGSLKGAKFISNTNTRKKDIEQMHLCIGFDGIEHGNDNLYTLLAINNVFGGGMSSRLFQKIREEKGLVYSIYSYPSSYSNAGLFTIYAGMNPEKLEEVVNLTVVEVNRLTKHGMQENDLIKSKEQLKGNYILGLDSTSSRMSSMGKSELLLGYINTPEEVLKKIDDINMASINEVIEKVFKIDKMSIAAVGNIDKNMNMTELLKTE